MAFRWIQFSDLHSDEDVVARILELEWGPLHAIVVTGGLTRDGSPSAALATRAMLDRMARELGAPVVAALGDEDRDKGDDEVVSRLFRDWLADDALRAQLDDPESKMSELVDGRYHDVASSLLGLPEVAASAFAGDTSLSLDVEGARVGFLALNSERIAPARAGQKRLRSLREAQLVAAAGGDLDGFLRRHDLVALVMESRFGELDSESQRVLDRRLGPNSIILCDGALVPLRAAREARRSTRLVVDGPSAAKGSAVAFCELDPRTQSGSVRVVETSGARKGTTIDSLELARPTHVPKRVERAIHAVKVTDFRGVATLDVELSTGSPLGGAWTCIAGINGAGKTTLLQAVALALLDQRDALQLGTSGLARMRRRAADGTHDSRIVLTDADGSERSVRIDATGPTHEGSIGSAKLVLGYGATRNLSEFDDQRYASASKATRRVITLFDPLARVARAEVVLEDHGDSRVLALVSRLASDVFGSDLDVRWVQGNLTFTQGGNTVSAIDLPDGFRSSIAWLADVCAAWCEEHPDSDDPAAIEAVVLVDEIDLHLHPSLQRSIVPRLRAALPRVQWIVTTHSPLVLGSFDTRELVALDRAERDGVRAIDRPILGFSSDDIYQWLMGTTPTSSALEEQMAKPTLPQAELDEMLEVSPEVDVEQARANIDRRRELLRKLQAGTLGRGGTGREGAE